jgi:putative DNA methylase
MTEPRRWYKPKLIEVSIPLEEINKESARENYIYRGNPSALHKWWAQRPLAACRAVLFAQLVDDPSAHPDKFPTEEAQEARRKDLHNIIKGLVKWENIHDEALLQKAHAEICDSCNGEPPAVCDPFAGGGSIPMEAQRLGLGVHASDLNPVAVLINKALIEVPPMFASRPPVFPGAASSKLMWPGATGLAEDVRRYGQWMRDEAEKRIGYLYPKVRLSDGTDTTVIAWIWARTVTCPNPACGGTMPLIRSFWLSQRKGRQRWIDPIPDGKRMRFEIRGPEGAPRGATIGRGGATCLICETPVPLAYIRDEGQAGRIGAQLMAVAAEGKRQRHYLAATAEHEKVADVARPDDLPYGELSTHPQYMSPPRYGMTEAVDLFTNRQLVALSTLSDLVHEVRERIVSDSGNAARADAVATYLSFVVSKTADYNCSVAVWYPQEDRPKNLFARQAIPMVWDYPEINVLGDIGGTWAGCLRVVADAMGGIPADVGRPVDVRQADARTAQIPKYCLVATDPPYYDNVPYADLSDFFYVWLRRTLGDLYPDLLATMLTPKNDELVADQVRLGGKKNASDFFETGFEKVFSRICQVAPHEFPITVVYGFKQSETDVKGDQVSTGWETLLQGMVRSGWAVTATWPMRTERSGRSRSINSNALASSIVLACRPRPANAEVTDRRGLIAVLREELPGALRKLQLGGVAPVDLPQAAIGPGMAVFSRYARVNEPDGSPMRVRPALALINQVLDEVLSQQEGDFNADTRWCLEWFKTYGFAEGPYGAAETLSKAKNTAVAGLARSGVLRSGAGKVRLLALADLPFGYDPGADDRVSEWEIVLHMAKRLNEQGADAAAQLLAAAKSVVDPDSVRELAYLLFSIAEKRGWADVALLFNGLGTSWPDLAEASRRLPAAAAVQDSLNFESEEG